MPEKVRSKKVEEALAPRMKHTAKKSDLAKDFLDVTRLIRSIQRAEGNIDCFRMAQSHCDQLDCNWRTYCREKTNSFDIERE